MHKKNFILTYIIIPVFLIETVAYGLAPESASQNYVTKAKIRAALERTRVMFAESDYAKKLLRLNNARCLLLSCGKYLVDEETPKDDLKLLRAIYHEDTEALMQIIARNEPDRYQGIKELILKYFPPGPANRLPIELYVNHTVASAFEWLLLVKEKTVPKDNLPRDIKPFLEKIEKIILAGITSYFHGDFWDADLRAEKIHEAIRQGMRFYTTAGENDETLLEIAGKLMNAEQYTAITVENMLNNLLFHHSETSKDVRTKVLDGIAHCLRSMKPMIRRAACKAIVTFFPDEPRVLLALKKFLIDPETSVQEAARDSISIICQSYPEAADQVIGFLDDFDPEVKARVLEILGDMENKPAAACARIISLFSDEEVRDYAIEALGKFGKEAAPAVPALIQLMNSGNLDAADALGKIGPEAKDAIPGLTALLDTEPRKAALVLGNIGIRDPAAVSKLLNLYETENDAGTKTSIGEALAKIGVHTEHYVDYWISRFAEDRDIRTIEILDSLFRKLKEGSIPATKGLSRESLIEKLAKVIRQAPYRCKERHISGVVDLYIKNAESPEIEAILPVLCATGIMNNCDGFYEILINLYPAHHDLIRRLLLDMIRSDNDNSELIFAVDFFASVKEDSDEFYKALVDLFKHDDIELWSSSGEIFSVLSQLIERNKAHETALLALFEREYPNTTAKNLIDFFRLTGKLSPAVKETLDKKGLIDAATGNIIRLGSVPSDPYSVMRIYGIKDIPDFSRRLAEGVQMLILIHKAGVKAHDTDSDSPHSYYAYLDKAIIKKAKERGYIVPQGFTDSEDGYELGRNYLSTEFEYLLEILEGLYKPMYIALCKKNGLRVDFYGTADFAFDLEFFEHCDNVIMMCLDALAGMKKAGIAPAAALLGALPYDPDFNEKLMEAFNAVTADAGDDAMAGLIPVMIDAAATLNVAGLKYDKEWYKPSQAIFGLFDKAAKGKASEDNIRWIIKSKNTPFLCDIFRRHPVLIAWNNVLSELSDILRHINTETALMNGKDKKNYFKALDDYFTTVVKTDNADVIVKEYQRMLSFAERSGKDWISDLKTLTRYKLSVNTYLNIIDDTATKEDITSILDKNDLGLWILIYKLKPSFFNTSLRGQAIKDLTMKILHEVDSYPENTQSALRQQFETSLNDYFRQFCAAPAVEDTFINECMTISELLSIVHDNLPSCLNSCCNIGKSLKTLRGLIDMLRLNNPLTRIIRMLGQDQRNGGYFETVRTIINVGQFENFTSIMVKIASSKKRTAPQQIAGMLEILSKEENLEQWNGKKWAQFKNEITRYFNAGFKDITLNLFKYFISHAKDTAKITEMRDDIKTVTLNLEWGNYFGVPENIKKKYGFSTEDEIAMISKYVPISNLTSRDYAGVYEEIKSELARRTPVSWQDEADPPLRALYSVKGVKLVVAYDPEHKVPFDRDDFHARIAGYADGENTIEGLLDKIGGYARSPDKNRIEEMKNIACLLALKNMAVESGPYKTVKTSDLELRDWLISWLTLLKDTYKEDTGTLVRKKVREEIAAMDETSFAALMEKIKIMDFLTIKGSKQLFKEDNDMISLLSDGAADTAEKIKLMSDIFARKWLVRISSEDILDEEIYSAWIDRGLDNLTKTLAKKCKAKDGTFSASEEAVRDILRKSLLQARLTAIKEMSGSATDIARKRKMAADRISGELLSMFTNDIRNIELELKGFKTVSQEVDAKQYAGFFDDMLHLMGFMMTGVCTWIARGWQVKQSGFHFGKIAIKDEDGKVLGLSQVQLLRCGITGLPDKVSQKGWRVLALPGINLNKGDEGRDYESAVLAILETAQRAAEASGMQGAFIPGSAAIYTNDPQIVKVINDLAGRGWLKNAALNETVTLSAAPAPAYTYNSGYLVTIPAENMALQKASLEDKVKQQQKKKEQLNDMSLPFANGLGDIVYREPQLDPEAADTLKGSIEKIISKIPAEIKENISILTSVKNIQIRVRIDTALEKSSINKSGGEAVLTVGKNIMYKPGRIESITLSEMVSELLAAVMLDDYLELKEASSVNENAYFKIEAAKALLNYRNYLPVYYKTECLRTNKWQESNYPDNMSAGDINSAYKQISDGLDQTVANMKGIFQHNIFFTVMDDGMPPYTVLNYLHLLFGISGVSDEDISNFLFSITKLDISDKPSIAGLRNCVTDFILGRKASVRIGGQALEKEKFINFYDPALFGELKENILTPETKTEFYGSLRKLIKLTLPLSENELNAEISRLVDKDLFSSDNKETAVRETMSEILTRRIGKTALERLIGHLSAAEFSFVPYLSVNHHELSEGEDADSYGFLSYVNDGIDYNLVFNGGPEEELGEEPVEAPFINDWVTDLFRMEPANAENMPRGKANEADDIGLDKHTEDASGPVNDFSDDVLDAFDAQAFRALAADAAAAYFEKDNKYTLTYDDSLSGPEKDIIDTYVKVLNEKLGVDISARGISKHRGSKNATINIYRSDKGGNQTGQGHVDVNIPEGELGEYLLRITGMINIALAASNINEADASLDNKAFKNKYEAVIGFIERQYTAISGETLGINGSVKEMLDMLQKIKLPNIVKLNPAELKLYYENARKALIAA